jgi:hypothetical protein
MKSLCLFIINQINLIKLDINNYYITNYSRIKQQVEVIIARQKRYERLMLKKKKERKRLSMKTCNLKKKQGLKEAGFDCH